MQRLLLLFLLIFTLVSATITSFFVQSPQLPDATDASSVTDADPEALPSVETGIAGISKYGNIVLTVPPQTLRELGFEPADLILVKIGNAETEMPVGTAYSDVDSGEPVCCFKTSSSGDELTVLAINAGNLASAMGIAEIRRIDADPGYEIVWLDGCSEATAVTLTMAQKQGFAEEYRMHQLGNTRTNNRADYAHLSDAAYANFRAVNTTGMGTDVLFRSSSPIDPALNRNAEADAALLAAGVRTVINMSDTEQSMRAYEGFAQTNYARCEILALNMNMDFRSADFREKLAGGFRCMASHEGPYLLHCKEGKDRTGFAVAVLECLMGASADEVVADYMLTFYNYYGIAPGTEQYDSIAKSNIKTTLANAFGVTSIDNAPDLAGCAYDYLKSIGMRDAEIAALKNNLQ